MATLDSALRPAWVFGTLRLWKPYMSVPILMERTADFTAQELASPKARRRALNHIFRFYIESTGRGAQRRTLAQNVWAAYCRGYGEHVLAPAFLTHLAAQVDLAQSAGVYFRANQAPGTPLASKELRAFLAAQKPEQNVTPTHIGAWLRTLTHFRILNLGERVGDYVVRRPLPVAGNIFPLLVYSWAGARGIACVDPARFAQDPILAYVERTGFDHYWRLYAGHLWFAEEINTGTDDPGTSSLHWRLRYTEPDDMARALINLLTIYRRPRRYIHLQNIRKDGLQYSLAPGRATWRKV